MSRLYEKYRKEVLPSLMQSLGYKTPMAVPKLEKIVINMGLGKPAGIGTQGESKAVFDQAARELGAITGQKPVETKARVSVAAFHIRRGKPVGMKVTLRRKRMYEFLDRLISVAVPRIRDFRGFSVRGFDPGGNYTFGISEQTVFPEIDIAKVQKTLGMDVTLAVRARKKEDSIQLLKRLGFPFREK